MPISANHWNDHQVCVIDVKTTGLDPDYNEIIQVCFLPLDSKLEVRQDVIPFDLDLKPIHPERVDDGALESYGQRIGFEDTDAKRGVKRKRYHLVKAMLTGHDPDFALRLLEDWLPGLNFHVTKLGTRKKIIALGHNYVFDRSFLIRWMGHDLYQQIFHYVYFDSKVTAESMNMRAALHSQPVFFNKTKLPWIANHYHIPITRSNDALADCETTRAIYKAMCQEGLF